MIDYVNYLLPLVGLFHVWKIKQCLESFLAYRLKVLGVKADLFLHTYSLFSLIQDQKDNGVSASQSSFSGGDDEAWEKGNNLRAPTLIRN